LALLRIGLQTIPEETMEQILAAATDDARNYLALVAAGVDDLTRGSGKPERCERSLRPQSARGCPFVPHGAADGGLHGARGGDDLGALDLAAGLVVGSSLPAAGASLLQALVVLKALQRDHSAPLLNVPDNGRRSPILSAYLFLSEKIYYHSFPVWFSHYAVWGTIPALLALVLRSYVFAPAAAAAGRTQVRHLEQDSWKALPNEN
jgi:hypothetical protein